MLVHAWCEYDFSGSFGGNNNEDIFNVDDGLTEEQINDLVVSYLEKNSGLSEDELDGLWGWSVFDPVSI